MTRATKNEKLLLRALRDDDANAFYRLGVRYLYGIGCNPCRMLGRVFLEKAAELGHTESFFLCHRIFSKGKKVIDDPSYERIAQEWFQGGKTDSSLLRYLRLGTRRQKRRIRSQNTCG